MIDDVIFLVSATQTQDEYGIYQQTETLRRVFAKVNSISRSEFYNAGRDGLNPSYEFTVFHGDYELETECFYNGDRYAIYRTFRVPGTDDMELYVERKGGTNGPNENNGGES